MSKRMPQIEFLRFLSFLVIFVWHCDTYSRGFSFVTGIPTTAAVSFFFVLSGFMTGYSQSGKENNKISEMTTFTYVRAKLIKLYPLYFLTIIMMAMFSPIPEAVARFEFYKLPSALLEMLKHLLLLQSWFPNGYFAYNCAGWFLSTLLFLLLLTPTVLKKVEKCQRSIMPALILAAFCCEIAYCFFTRNLKLEYFQYVFPICRIFEYFGALILGFYMKGIENKSVNDGKQMVVIFTILEILSLCIWIVLTMFTNFEIGWIVKLVSWFIPSCLIMCTFICGRGLVSRFFCNKVLAVLGGITFECFLIHTVIIRIYHEVSGDYGGITILGNVFSMVFILILTIVMALLFKKDDKLIK